MSKVIKKQHGLFQKYFCIVFFNHFTTTKGSGVRIGKGKGSHQFFAYNVFIGSIIYTFKRIEKNKKILAGFFKKKTSFKGLCKQNFFICKKSEYSVIGNTLVFQTNVESSNLFARSFSR